MMLKASEMQQGTRAEVALQPMTSETGATCSTFAASDPHGPAASRAERLTHHPQAPQRSPPPMRSCRPAVGAVTRSSRAPGPRHLATATTTAPGHAEALMLSKAFRAAWAARRRLEPLVVGEPSSEDTSTTSSPAVAPRNT